MARGTVRVGNFEATYPGVFAGQRPVGMVRVGKTPIVAYRGSEGLGVLSKCGADMENYLPYLPFERAKPHLTCGNAQGGYFGLPALGSEA